METTGPACAQLNVPQIWGIHMQSTERGRLPQPYPRRKGSAAPAALGSVSTASCGRNDSPVAMAQQQRCSARGAMLLTGTTVDSLLQVASDRSPLRLERFCRDRQPGGFRGCVQGPRRDTDAYTDAGTHLWPRCCSRASSTARSMGWRGLRKQQATHCCLVVQPWGFCAGHPTESQALACGQGAAAVPPGWRCW